MSITEILVILVVALIVFGPKRLPEIAQLLGKCFGTFSRFMRDATQTTISNADKSEPSDQSQSKNITNEKSNSNP